MQRCVAASVVTATSALVAYIGSHYPTLPIAELAYSAGIVGTVTGMACGCISAVEIWADITTNRRWDELEKKMLHKR